MRTFKFKAWDTIQKKWQNDEFIISTMNGGAIEFCGVSTENDPSQINEYVIFCQFTGLHDKNGKEIYEGDICNRPSSNGTKEQLAIGFIVFYKGSFCFNRLNSNLRIAVDNLVYHYAECEVIGNIYENPELLNQQS